MAKKRRKAPEATSWIVPVRVTMRGSCIVDANSAEEALENVDGDIDIDGSFCEIVDWEVTGDPEPNI